MPGSRCRADALVIGAEGKGFRHLTRVRCDVVARLKLPGRITALNVSNATAIALHVASAKFAAATLRRFSRRSDG